MSLQDERDRFGELLVQLVRDEAIEDGDRHLAGRMVGPQARRWQTFVERGDVQAALHEAIPDIVDGVLFLLLDAIDNHHLPLGWRMPDGTYESLEEVVLGESAGLYIGGEDGWIRRFSHQRFTEDFPPSR
jgi:hypothetical protein